METTPHPPPPPTKVRAWGLLLFVAQHLSPPRRIHKPPYYPALSCVWQSIPACLIVPITQCLHPSTRISSHTTTQIEIFIVFLQLAVAAIGSTGCWACQAAVVGAGRGLTWKSGQWIRVAMDTLSNCNSLGTYMDVCMRFRMEVVHSRQLQYQVDLDPISKGQIREIIWVVQSWSPSLRFWKVL